MNLILILLICSEAVHASNLEGKLASLTMLIAEDWTVLIVTIDVQIVGHFIPVIDPTSLGSISDIKALFAVAILTLNPYSIVLFLRNEASAAFGLERELRKFTLNYFVSFVLIPNALDPIDTDRVCPKSLLIFTSFEARYKLDWLQDSVNLWTEKAFDLCALLSRIGFQVSAPGTIPFAIRNLTEELASIAGLVNSNKAILANDDLVSFIIVVIEANIADDVIVILVLIDSDLLIWVVWIDLIALFIVSLNRSLINLHAILEHRDSLRCTLFASLLTRLNLSRPASTQCTEPKASDLSLLNTSLWHEPTRPQYLITTHLTHHSALNT